MAIWVGSREENLGRPAVQCKCVSNHWCCCQLVLLLAYCYSTAAVGAGVR